MQEPYPPSRNNQHFREIAEIWDMQRSLYIAMLLSDFIIAKESFVLKDTNEHFQDAKA